jgi:hypothetical protein
VSSLTAPLFKTFHNMFCLKVSECVHQFFLYHYCNIKSDSL